jgi:hypothetical protein
MKSQLIRVATLSALVLASSVLTFAAGQPKLHRYSKGQEQDRTGITQAVQQGKGSGMTRNQPSLSANAYRVQTAQDGAAVRDESGAVHSNIGDVAFRK